LSVCFEAGLETCEWTLARGAGARLIRREMRRRAAVEPVIGHIKAEHRMGRNHLKGRHGDRCNAVLAAAGYNFGLLLCWLERLLRALIRALLPTPWRLQTPKPAEPEPKRG
jgi:hypothetical protein